MENITVPSIPYVFSSLSSSVRKQTIFSQYNQGLCLFHLEISSAKQGYTAMVTHDPCILDPEQVGFKADLND